MYSDDYCVDDIYDDDDDDYEMQYADDGRTLTMAQLEEILCEVYGDSEYDRTSGCYHGHKWFSVDSILEAVSYRV